MSTCSYPGCDQPVHIKKSGLCRRHYKQHWRGTLTPPGQEYGSPSGHGQYGILATDGIQVMCHECGQWKKTLGKHLPAVHEMTAREYKIRHGLPLTKALMGDRLKEGFSASAKEHLGTEAWKKLEENRDPIKASQAREEIAFESMARQAGLTPEKSILKLSRIPRKPLRWQTCTICGKKYQNVTTTKTCGRELCIQISNYESQPTYKEMERRAEMHEGQGMNFSEIARQVGVSPQAVRISYRGWQRYKKWRSELNQA